MLDHIIFMLDHIKSVFTQKQISTRSPQTDTCRTENRTPVHVTNSPETDLPRACRITPVICPVTLIHSFFRLAIETILNGGQAEKETGLTGERKRHKPEFTGALRLFQSRDPILAKWSFFMEKQMLKEKKKAFGKIKKPKRKHHRIILK